MEKLLLIGINTRSMIESGLKLNYTIYSTSYFSTSDVPSIENQKIILDESINPDCGVFEFQQLHLHHSHKKFRELKIRL